MNKSVYKSDVGGRKAMGRSCTSLSDYVGWRGVLNQITGPDKSKGERHGARGFYGLCERYDWWSESIRYDRVLFRRETMKK